MTDRSPPVPRRRLAQLDGVRCLAVSMVLAYHGGVPGLSVAGFYGVDVFFVLSGFLITSLLLREGRASGRLDLGAFWGRRARRLLPALAVMLAAVAGYVVFVAPAGRYPGFWGDALSVVAYVSNWHFIASSSNYFAASAAPSLLTHTWSLAIEEQFYVVWPLLLWATLRVGRRLGRDPAGAVLAVGVAGAAGSAIWMAVLYRSGADPSRLYYGTDTHAQSILVGAAVAAALAGGRLPRRWSRAAPAAAAVAVAGLAWAACRLGASDPLSYQGGFLAVALLAGLLISSLVAAPAALPARILSARPLAYVGRISYGMYLWYFPLFAVLDHSSTGLSGPPLFALRALCDLGVAAASFHLLEVRVLRAAAVRRPRPLVVAGSVAATASVVAAAAVITATSALTPAPAGAGAGLVRSTAQALPAAAGGWGGSPPGGPATTGRRPLRLLVTGDSTGLTLGLALSFPAVESRYGLVVDDAALLGCGVAVSASVDAHGQASTPPAPCNPATPPGRQWPALLRRQVAAFRPDVVLVAAGRWEVQSRRPAPGSPWTDLSRPADRRYVQAQLRLAASIALSGGARVALATAPCFSSGEQPDGAPWPEDRPSRLREYNTLVRTVAAGIGGRAAAVVDLDAMVCPGGRFATSIGGTIVRAPDGVHYPFFDPSAPDRRAPDTEAEAERFGAWIAPRVLAALAPTGPAATG